MDQRNRLALVAAAGLLLGGCNRTPEVAPPPPLPDPTVPTSRPVIPGPTTAPTALAIPKPPPEEPKLPIGPPAAFLMIDRHPVQFPPARIVIKANGLAQTARVYSDDPPEAINANYSGSSFYLDMNLTTLPGGKSGDLADAVWVKGENPDDPNGVKPPADPPKAAGRKASSPNGIYLDGGRRVLQPLRATVTFEPREGGWVLVRVSGTFNEFAAGADAALVGQVHVTGMLSAQPAE